MKTKIIPFDLYTAKKIQSGGIKGRIKQIHGEEVQVLCWDLANRSKNIMAVRHMYFEGDEFHGEHVDEYGADGLFYDRSDGLEQNDLVLEVPDNEPQFKVGDNVRVRPNDTHSHFVKQYDNCIGKIVGTHHEYFVVIVTGAFQDQFLAEELELVEETAKHEFKPFDRVLVRDRDGVWHPSLYATTDGLLYYTIDCKNWQQCIPYECNEDLVRTTNMPKED